METRILRHEIKAKLKVNNIDENDADFILAEVLNSSPTKLVLIDEIPDEKLNEINSAVEKRMTGMPVDKIFNRAYFYGLKFKVNENVLTPRCDSEILVERAIKEIKDNNYKTVLDLCTGSGCLAVAIKKNCDVEITASDISTKALAVAKTNAKLNNVEIDFVKSDMFNAIDKKYDLIITNPPYIDSDEIKDLDREVKDFDPKLALDGGEMGLKFYSIIHDNLRKFLSDNGKIIMEIGDEQKEMVKSIFNDFEFEDCLLDYAGHDRVMIFKK